MVYLYPANKMENLLALFNKIQTLSPLSVFEKELVIVQNAGMQHWLSMSIANERRIAMNIDYALPAQFLWKLLRTMAVDEEVQEQSPYSREVLTWRIDALLATDSVKNSTEFKAATNFWLTESSIEQQCLKRYQLAQVTADLFEQYLIFRPEWINNWCHGNVAIGDSTVSSINELETTASALLWQSKLWQLLHAQLPYNPVALMKDACLHLKKNKHLLPRRISFFGLNAMAPMWLNFIEQIGQHIDVHFFHLNPCFDYWGEIQTEKQAIKQLTSWTADITDLSHVIGNPLLANLGQQGREFIALLQNISTINIDVFEQHDLTLSSNSNDNVHQPRKILWQVQNDILQLQDARVLHKQSKAIRPIIDDSITITRCHSAFREVQALHDWLLHQLNQDKTLTPKDILVMCPQIENYAPYVNAVFTRGWQDIADDVPPLPCSIADRTSKDSDPTVVAFLDMLSMPDSRFHVTSVIALLRVPAVQAKFGFSSEDINTLCLWLEQASIHWGLSQDHKSPLLIEGSSNAFTWQQGLSRLLQGFAYSDQESLYGEILTLPLVEGLNGALLGQLMLFVERLQLMAIALSKPRTPKQWQNYLTNMLETMFSLVGEQSLTVIQNAIANLGEYTHEADYQEVVALSVIKAFLDNHFSVPDPGRQFMVGQVTFCSMLPMRSIPFKVIAVLGLNDGEFPRQRQPLAFDLMAMTPVKLGDRSRRGDDRYLFLEAIISARQSLYLSYQGRNVSNNKKKEPSIVLQEFMDYLAHGYHWDCQNGDGLHIRQMPLQPFSGQNYTGKWASFDANWLSLINSHKANQLQDKEDTVLTKTPVTSSPDEVTELSIEQLVRFFMHPSKWYAQKALNLYFEQHEAVPEDTETFSYDRLASYHLKQAMLSQLLSSEKNQSLDKVIASAKLSGRFADSPVTDQLFDKWQSDSESFANIIKQLGFNEPNIETIDYLLELPNGNKIRLVGQLPRCQDSIVAFRSSTAKAKDMFTLYCYQLLAQVCQETVNFEFKQTLGVYFDTKNQKVEQVRFSAIEQPKQQLIQLVSSYLCGQHEPLLLNANIAHKYYTARSFAQLQFEKFWHDENAFNSPCDDPYMQFFWPQCPVFHELEPELAAIYYSLYHHVNKTKLEVGK